MADGSDAYSVVLRFEADEESLRKIQEQLDNMHIPIQVTRTPKPSSGDSDSDADPGDTGKESKSTANSLKEALKEYASDDGNKSRLITGTIKSAEVAISSGLKKGFSIVEDIYSRLKASSPLLQAIESIFQLAMMLFFMPMGNKLGEILIPATLELLDNVIKMWDAFEGQTLGQMFATATTQGVKLFGEYFNTIGDLLIEQGGMVGNIGTLLKTLGAFIEGPGVGVLNSILGVATFVLGNFKHFVSLWVAMKAAEITMNAAGFLGEAVGVKAAVGATALVSLAAFGTSEALMMGLGKEKGGYVPATPGGSLRVLGEGGRGEYVIPEDKMGSVGGGTIINNFYGYNEDQLVQKVNDVVNQQVSQSRLRSGF